MDIGGMHTSNNSFHDYSYSYASVNAGGVELMHKPALMYFSYAMKYTSTG